MNASTSGWTGHGSPTRRWALAAGVVCALAWGCSGSDGDTDTAEDASTASDSGGAGPVAPAARRKPDGALCPPGTWYDPVTDDCLSAGPPECAGLLHEAPASCLPQACADLRDHDGKPCEAGSAGCLPLSRACTSEERAKGKGCPAGSWPDPGAGGSCVMAGMWPAAPSLDDAPPPAPQPPRWCWDLRDTQGKTCASGEAGCTPRGRRCTAEEFKAKGGCPAGEMPGNGGGCVSVEATWTCPPGFRPDEAAPKNVAGLPPCVPDPADCGQDPFGGVQPAANTRFVDLQAPAGGDGSREKPYNKLTAGVSATPAGGTLAVAAGTYKEGIILSKPMTVIGRCAAMVTFDSDMSAGVSTLASGGPGPRLVQGVTLTGTVKGANAISKVELRLRRVWLHGTGRTAFYAANAGSVIEATDCVSDETGAAPKDADDGVYARAGARVTLQRVRISGPRGVGLFARDPGTVVQADDVLVDATTPGIIAGSVGQGIAAQGGAQLSLRRVRVVGSHAIGVHIMQSGTRLDATGLVIGGTQPRADGAFGYGAMVTQGAQVQVDGGRVHANTYVGLYASGAGTGLRLAGVRIDGQLPSPNSNEGGLGVSTLDGASTEVVGCLVDGNRGAGVNATGAGARVVVEASLLEKTLPGANDGSGGMGVLAFIGARVDVIASRVRANMGGGVGCSSPDDLAPPRCRVVGSLLDDNLQSAPYVLNGWGVLVNGDSQLSGSRVRGNATAGVVCVHATGKLKVGGAVIDASLLHRDSPSVASGVGLLVRFGCALDLQASRVWANHSAGLYATDSPLQIQASVIAGTLTGKGQGARVNQTVFGDGIVAIRSPLVSVGQTSLAANERAGALLSDCEQANLSQVVASGGMYGLVTQGKTTASQTGVLLTDNSLANVAGDSGLAVPAPPEVLLPGQ